jgi:hypothetical protein
MINQHCGGGAGLSKSKKNNAKFTQNNNIYIVLFSIILATLAIPRNPKQRGAGRDKAGKNGAGQQ